MAALVAGVQYGLSSHSNFPESKSLIFVKLTDSAQRAIEDFLHNGNTTKQTPTIQFLGNEGQLSFPSAQSGHGSAGFTFSLSGNQDIEGPQGGFECIQRTGPKSLESLGTLPWKMRIRANDDVYETTRHRMAAAEENIKNKCTRVIKANGPDIGRKVKVKTTGRTITPIARQQHRDTPPSIPASSSQSSSSSSSHRASPRSPIFILPTLTPRRNQRFTGKLRGCEKQSQKREGLNEIAIYIEREREREREREKEKWNGRGENEGKVKTKINLRP